MKIKRILRTLLWCLLIFLVFAVIWWGGPELRLGDARPLEPVGWRLALIGLLLFLLALRPLLRALSYLLSRLKPAKEEPVVDETLNACRAFRSQLKTQTGRKFSGFCPDYLVIGRAELIDDLLAKWPSAVAWQVRLDGAASAFMSEGRVYLCPESDTLAAWGKLLRWCTRLRGVLAVADAHSWLDDAALRSDVEQLHGHGRLWHRLTGRVLPVWLLALSSDPTGERYGWSAAMSSAPWGMSFPPGRFSQAACESLTAELLRAMDHTLADPGASGAQTQNWLHIRARTERLLGRAKDEFKRQSDRSLKPRLSLRGMHFGWSDENRVHGLAGMLSVLQHDRGHASFSTGWTWAGWGLGTLVGVLLAALALDATWLRLMRHQEVLHGWSVHVPTMPVVQLMNPSTQATVGDGLLALNDLDDFVERSSTQLGESLPEPARALVEQWHANGVHGRVIPLLKKDGAQSFRELAGSPADRYALLSFSQMLDTPHRGNLPLMRLVLGDLGLSPAQVNNFLGRWVRAGARAPTADEENETRWQRTALREDQYTLEAMIWTAMRDQLRPADALDFSFDRYMGPNAAWFMPVGEVDWFFTDEGVTRGFRAGRSRYEQWNEEYRWVMGEPAREFSLDEQEAMEVRLRTRYVRDATAAWQLWLEKLRLREVTDLPEAVDRAQLFSSEASPLIPMLDLLERHMPLPPSGQGSLWMRIKSRVTADWALLQYNLGWRRSPKPAQPRSDPRIGIGQNFGVLQMYFSNPSGKSPARDRLLLAVKNISDYLNRLNASEQIGSRVPKSAVLVKLRAEALRMPSPLRELILSLADTSEQQAKSAGAASLRSSLEALTSFQLCQRAPVQPLSVRAETELPWTLFLDEFGPMGKLAEIWKEYNSDPQFLKDLTERKTGGNAKGVHPAQWLQRAVAISNAWFPKPDQSITFRLKAVALSPNIRVVRLAIGDSVWSYSHGQIMETRMQWAPASTIPKVDMEIEALNGEVQKLSYQGSWALFRWASQARQPAMADTSKVLLDFDGPQGAVQLMVISDNLRNPFDVRLYEGLCTQ